MSKQDDVSQNHRSFKSHLNLLLKPIMCTVIQLKHRNFISTFNAVKTALSESGIGNRGSFPSTFGLNFMDIFNLHELLGKFELKF
jgi:hypothetical protein